MSESWFLQHGIILGYILSDVMRREATDEIRSVRPELKIDEYFNGEVLEKEYDNGEYAVAEHRYESSQVSKVVPLE